MCCVHGPRGRVGGGTIVVRGVGGAVGDCFVLVVALLECTLARTSSETAGFEDHWIRGGTEGGFLGVGFPG